MVDPTHRLRLPFNVNAFDVRLRVQHRAFNILAEMAMKSQDPSHDNGYIYRNGYVAMLQGSYSKRGMSLPNPKVEMPLAETQMATVLSNADPHGAGRHC